MDELIKLSGSTGRSSLAFQLKAAERCSAHRVVMIGSETLWSNVGGYGDPIATVYRYNCLKCMQDPSELTVYETPEKP